MTASLGSSTTPEIVYAGFRVAEACAAGDTCELAAIEPNSSTQMKAWLTTPAIRQLRRFKPQPTLFLPNQKQPATAPAFWLALQSTACSANRSERNQRGTTTSTISFSSTRPDKI